VCYNFKNLINHRIIATVYQADSLSVFEFIFLTYNQKSRKAKKQGFCPVFLFCNFSKNTLQQDEGGAII
jgi:hypothetical protein